MSEFVGESSENSPLNNWIAIVVAVSAAFVTIVNIKDNNIVQAMSQAQAHAVDSWSYYQAKGIKEHLAENTKAQLSMQLVYQPNMSAAVKAKVDALLKNYSDQIAKYEQEKSDIKAQAEGFQKEYEDLNIHDDQFDMSEALISLSMAILGISALTKKKPLFALGLATSMVGIIFGLAGFAGWNIHPDWLAHLLG